MNTVFKILDLYIIPGMLFTAWLALYFLSEVQGIGAWGMGLGFIVVWATYFFYRTLRHHAAASRMAATGEADELYALAETELQRRVTLRGRLSWRIYRAIALELRGDHDAARTALDEIDMTAVPSSARRTWGVMIASTRIQIAVAKGDGARARAEYEVLVPMLRDVRGTAASVLGSESEALVLHAEGRDAEARPIFEKLARDIRVSSATRALCKYYLGLKIEAAKLAPGMWLAQKEPMTASPAPSAET